MHKYVKECINGLEAIFIHHTKIQNIFHGQSQHFQKQIVKYKKTEMNIAETKITYYIIFKLDKMLQYKYCPLKILDIYLEYILHQ